MGKPLDFEPNPEFTVQGCRLVQTCEACPEQYDVFMGAAQIGYLRLRHGYFRADYPYCGGEIVYEAEPKGDGMFEDSERAAYLSAAVSALLARFERDEWRRS